MNPPPNLPRTTDAERRARIERVRLALGDALRGCRGWRSVLRWFRRACLQGRDESQVLHAQPALELEFEGRGLLLAADAAGVLEQRSVGILSDQVNLPPVGPVAPHEDNLDFLICEHLFEQSSNPFGALRRHLAGLRTGGLAILSFRVQDSGPDGSRAATPLEHLILDDIEPGRGGAERQHVHAFDPPLLEAVLEEVRRQDSLELILLLETAGQGAPEQIAALRKGGPAAPKRAEESPLFTGLRREGALLVLLHDSPFRFGAGGTECHTLDLVAHLKLKQAVIVYPSNPHLVSAAIITEGDISGARYCRFPLREPLSLYMHRHAEAEELLLYLARLCGARAVLIQHLRRWPLAAVENLHRAGLPYVCVTHDFFAVCPNLNLTHPKTLRPCGAHADAAGESESCLREYFEAQTQQMMTLPCEFKGLLRRHQTLFGAILRGAEAVVFPSESARRRVLAGLPEGKENVNTHLIPHGYPQAVGTPAVPPPRSDGVLRVGLLGMLMLPAKGSELLVEVLSLSGGLPLEWHLFGTVDAGSFRRRLEATGARLVLHGTYERKDIVSRLRAAGVDVALFTSVAEETFSYTLSEVWCAGIPPIVPRLGALGERVEKSGLGWLIEPRSAAAARDMLRDLAQAPSKVAEVRARLGSFRHTTLEENAAAYRELLGPLLQAGARSSAFPEGHWPSALAEEARRKAAFESSRKTVLALDAGNQFAGITAVNQASLLLRGGALLMHSSGNDPALALPACVFVRGRRYMLRLDLASPAEDELRVYYGTRAQPAWAEERSIRIVVQPGRGEVFIELAADLAGPLRLDPGTMPGEYQLHAVEIRELRGLTRRGLKGERG